MPLARTIITLIVVVFFAGCSASPPPASTATLQTAAPTATSAILQAEAPTATSATVPTAEATATAPATAPTAAPMATQAIIAPAPEKLLPAPLYFIEERSQQVVRLETDGRSTTQISFEAEPVLELSVASEAGTLAYVVGDEASVERTLVLLDGAGRRELLAENISFPAISSDGQRVAYRLDEPAAGLIVGRDEAPSGVWSSLPFGPGRPALVLPDVPGDGVYSPDTPSWSYFPLSFSPDSTQLALFAYDLDGPAIPGGELVILGENPDELVRGPTCCEEPLWSADGAVLHNSGGAPGPDLRYGLYRSDAGSGAETAVIEQTPDGPVPLVSIPRQLADGNLYALVELVTAEVVGWDYEFQPRLTRVERDGTLTPLSQPLASPIDAVWAPDASGAVVAQSAALIWAPAAEQPLVPLAARGRPIDWAFTELTAGECANFAPVAFQAPAARAFSGAARDIQARLAARGFTPGPVDGFYGNQTRAAVEAFQRNENLPITGDVDCATWKALLS